MCDADLDQLAGAVQADFLCQLRCAEHLWSEVVDVGDGLGTKSLNGREELWDLVYSLENNNICAVTFILRDAERQTELKNNGHADNKLSRVNLTAS